MTEAAGYGAVVWSQFRRNRPAVFGLWCIGALALLAVYAPLLSLDQPLLWRGAEGLEFPLFRALFNRLLFENAVDVFFNLLLVLSPIYAVVYRAAWPRVGRLRVLGALALFHFAAFAALAPERIGPFANPLHGSARIVDFEAPGAEAADAPFAIFPLRPYSYRETDPARSVRPPSSEHWFGTDKEGRDVFARMLYGTRISLTIGVVAVAIYVTIGVVLGALAGYFGGWVDSAISRLIEVMICFPTFFLILTLAALVQERSIFHVMVIIGVTGWTGVARLIRAEFLKHKNLEYAQAARALGLRRRRIIFRHILPNAIAPVLVTATFGIASAILIESSLSFLGVGDITVPSWGAILNSGRLEGKLWLIVAPGAAIFFMVSAFNLVGEALRDALDPKLRV
ncbi:MAG: ABC transporter permease [Myxococcales bacterium]|nr:ABC transporter permease [Myxococcales bacterium]